MKISVSRVINNGKRVWMVSRFEAGKRVRSYHAKKAKAEAEAVRLRGQVKTVGGTWLSLSAEDRERLTILADVATKRGVSLDDVLLKMREEKPAVKAPTLKETIDEMILAKENAQRSEDYADALKSILGDFSKGIEALSITAPTIEHVEAFLARKELVSRPTLRSRLSALFRYAVRRGYRPDNPCDRLEPVKVPRNPPVVFTPEQAGLCLDWLKENRPLALAWFVLSTFCGLRPEEAEAIEPRQVNFDEGWVRVERTKVKYGRVVYPKPEAMALLKWAMEHGGELPLHPAKKRKTIQGWVTRWRNKAGQVEKQKHPGLRGLLGWERWPKDVTRHSAASYWLADCQDAAKVAKALGNSEEVLKRHYEALVTRSQAVKFWSIRPASG